MPDDKRGLNYTLLESYPYIVSFAGSSPKPFAMHLSRPFFFLVHVINISIPNTQHPNTIP